MAGSAVLQGRVARTISGFDPRLLLPLLLLLMILPLPTRADIPCAPPNTLIQVNYEGNTLPQDDPITPWKLNVVGDATARVENGILIVDASSPGAGILYGRDEPSLTSAPSYAIEGRMWFNNFVIPPSGSTAGISIVDSEKDVSLHFQDGTNHRVVLEVGTGVRPEYLVNFTQPHDYRVEVIRHQNVVVSLDGVEVFNVAYADLPDVSSSPSTGILLSGFFGYESVSYWDYVLYTICATPAVNRPPIANAGQNIEASVGDFVTLDGSASFDPDADPITYFWSQILGPPAHLDDPTSPKPSFFVPQSVDGSSIVFSLVVSDGRLQSQPSTVGVLIHATSPDEGINGLLSGVQGYNAPANRKRRLLRDLQDAITTNDCSRKLPLLQQFLSEVNQDKGKWLDAATAATWQDEAQTLIDEIGPCTTSCRMDGGIEGSNLSRDATILTSTGGEAPPPDVPASPLTYGASKAIDGDDGTVWVAPGYGNEVIIDLGAKEVVTGIRVLSPLPQTYRLYTWNNLTLSWNLVAHRTSPITEGIEDICDTATQFVRYVNESTTGSSDTQVAEIQIIGDRSRQPQTEWLGTDPALSHAVGHAEGTSWVIGPSDGTNVWMSTGPHVRVTAGARWVNFQLHSQGLSATGEPIGRVMVVREKSGQEFLETEALILGNGKPDTKSIEFLAEVGSRYSFAVYYQGGVGLVLDRIILKDHSGTYATDTKSFLVEAAGRGIAIRDPEHALNGTRVRLPPGAVPAGTVLNIGLGRPWAPIGGGSPVINSVNLAAANKSPVPLNGSIRVRVPIHPRELRAAGIRGEDLQFNVQTVNGTIVTLGTGMRRNWSIPPTALSPPVQLNGNGLAYRIDQVLRIPIPQPFGPVPFPIPPPFDGFAKDFDGFNLFHFAMDEPQNATALNDSSNSAIGGHPGTIAGAAQPGVPGCFGNSVEFNGGYVTVGIGNRIPRAFAFDGWVRMDTDFEYADQERVILSQKGNFRLVLKRLFSYSYGFVVLEVFDSKDGNYHVVADTRYDAFINNAWINIGQWRHIVAIFDGHVKGRIYVDGLLDTTFINNYFETSLNSPFDPSQQPTWPRTLSGQQAPVVLGASLEDGQPLGLFLGTMDEVRFSDLTRFRVNDPLPWTCPPHCRPGEHGTGGQYDNIFLRDWDFYPWGGAGLDAYMYFDHRIPYIQNVTDHSAVITWRRKCSQAEPEPYTVSMKYQPEIDLYYGEAGYPMSNHLVVTPATIESFRDNFPDCQYQWTLEDLRPSTWYHYRVSERANFFGWQPSFVFEPTSDAYFKTAPLELDDQMEFYAFGDFSATYDGLIVGYDDKIEYEGYLASYLYDTTLFGENPSLWLALGDLSQDGSYNKHNFEAYMFGVFNKLHWISPDNGNGFYNGLLEGVPVFGTLGNHNWSDHPGNGLGGGEASEYFGNLNALPTRNYSNTIRFKYPSSSYSFDYGNVHIFSFGFAVENDCGDFYDSTNSINDPKVDRSCHIDTNWTSDLPEMDAWYEWPQDSEQVKWLKRDLWNYKNDPGIWKIAIFHVPLDNLWRRIDISSRLARLLELADVDLILVGHNHTYNRTTTQGLSTQFEQPQPSQIATEITAGTGGWRHAWDTGSEECKSLGSVRIFVDGNIMLFEYDDLFTGNRDVCLMLKGVDGIDKSNCIPILPVDDPNIVPVVYRFPEWECPPPSYHEGSRCLHWDTQVPELYGTIGRCLSPRVWYPNNRWGGLRCIPRESWDQAWE